MRLIACILLLIIGYNCTSTKAISSPNAVARLDELNGTWVPIKQEIGGTSLPHAAFEKQKLIISDSTYTFIAESVDKGVVRYRDYKMDIYGREGVNAGKHFTARYKLKAGRLTICYNLSGDGYPETFETKGKPRFFLCVFKKE